MRCVSLILGFALVCTSATGCGAPSDAGTTAQDGTNGSPSAGGGPSTTSDASISDGGIGGTAAAFTPEQRQVCEQVGAASCDKLQQCNPAVYASSFPSRELCTALEARDCVATLDALTNVNVTALAACAEAIGAQGCGDWFSRTPPECVRTGALPLGAVCGRNEECASGLCSQDACVARGKAGDSCFGWDSCDAGLTCVSGVCEAPLEPGDACEGLVTACPYPTTCIDGICAEPAVGTPCTLASTVCGEAWGLGTCDAGLCLGGGCSGVCTERVIVGQGEGCHRQFLCDATTICLLYPAGDSAWGTCTPRLAVGEACLMNPSLSEPQCAIGTECQDGVCVAIVEL